MRYTINRVGVNGDAHADGAGPATPHKTFTSIEEKVTVVMEPDGAIRAASVSMTTVLGYDPGQLSASGFFHLVHDGDLLSVFRTISDLVTGYAREAEVNLHVRDAGGEWKACRGFARLKLDHGVVASIVLTLSPVVEALTS